MFIKSSGSNKLHMKLSKEIKGNIMNLTFLVLF